MIYFLRTLAYKTFPLYFNNPAEEKEPTLLDQLDFLIAEQEEKVFDYKVQAIEANAELAAAEKILEDLEFQRGYYVSICVRRDMT